jgi:hypothetical protein
LILIAAFQTHADIIIARTGAPISNPFTGVEYVSWTQTGTFSNVTIQANLSSTSGTASGNVYLTTQVGVGTTVAQQIATAAVSTSNTASSGLATTLLSGLTLGPGTYYLVVSGLHLGLAFSGAPVTVVGTGVTGNPDAVGGVVAAYPPATSPFFTKGQLILFSATGALGAGMVTAAPALSMFALILTALMLLVSGLALLKFYRPQE